MLYPKSCVWAFALILLAICSGQLHAQTFANEELDGIIGINQVPSDWEWVEEDDPNCLCWTASSDVTGSSGPNLGIGISGDPFSGDTFVSGVHGHLNNNLYREGIQQLVEGFTPGESYTMGFWQSVVKQSTSQDQSGSWSVYVDGILIETTTPTFSEAVYNDLDFPWEYREVSFVATESSHLIQFLPLDDDDNLEIGTGITGGLRMGIDLIQFVACAGLQVSLEPTMEACASSPLILDVTIENATYLWQDGSTSPLFEVSESGTYSVVVSLEECTSEEQVQVTIHPDPVVDFGPDTEMCETETLELSAFQSGATYLWQDESTSSDYTISNAGEYWVTVDLNGCLASDSISVTTLPVPEVVLPPQVNLCEGDSLLVDVALTGGSYLWQNGSTDAAIEVTEAGEYWVEVTVDNCMSSDTMNIDFFSLALPQLGNDTSLCAGAVLLLEGSQPGVNYLWQDGSEMGTYTVNQAGTYWVEVAIEGCESLTDSVVVTYQALPMVAFGDDAIVCDGESLLLDASLPDSEYLWQDGSVGATFDVTEAGAYWVEVTVNNCTSSDTINIDLVSLALPQLGNDTSLCAGTVLLLDATQNGVTYIWQDGSTLPTHTVSGPGTYWVQVDIEGCNALTDSVEVAFQDLPLVALGDDVDMCEGETLLLEASVDGGTYLWQDNSEGPTFLITQSGLYTVTVSVAGCTTTSELNADYHPLPDLDLGNDVELCEGEVLMVTAGSAEQSYLWHDGSDQPHYQITGTETIWVVASNGFCITSDTLTSTYTLLPVFTWADEMELCIYQSLTLNPMLPAYTELLWEDGSTGPVLVVDAPGLYTVEATINNCSSEDQVWVTEVLCEIELAFPNVFTPNQDGANDVFVPLLFLGVEDISFQVFNRWGNLMYSSEGDQVAWDGRNPNGDPAVSGTYYWVAEYKGFTGEKFNTSGTITLLHD